MLTELHATNAKAAQDDAYQCSGYWGSAAQGATGVATYDYLWAQHDGLEGSISAVVSRCVEAEQTGGYVPTEDVDLAVCRFSTQLDIASTLVRDGFESWISLVHHDKIEKQLGHGGLD